MPARPIAADPPPSLPASGHGVIIGFGLPGRAVAETLTHLGIPFAVIEANPAVVDRCRDNGLPMLQGDGRDVRLLQQVNIRTARFVAIMVPGDDVMLQILDSVRSLAPAVTVLARAHYTSAALKALHNGAQQVVAEEQVVAESASAVVRRMFASSPA